MKCNIASDKQQQRNAHERIKILFQHLHPLPSNEALVGVETQIIQHIQNEQLQLAHVSGKGYSFIPAKIATYFENFKLRLPESISQHLKPEHYEKLIWLCKVIIKVNPRFYWALAIQGIVLLAQGRSNEAFHVFLDAIRHKYCYAAIPLFYCCDLMTIISLIREGINLLYLKDFKNALKACDLLIKAESKDACIAGYWLKGIIYLIKGEYKEALDSFLGATKLSQSNYHLPNYLMAIAYSKQHDYRSAEAAIDSAIKGKADDHKLYWRKAFVKFNEKDYQEALAAINLAILNKKEGYEPYHYFKAILLLKLGCYQEAIIACDEAIRDKCDDYESYFIKAKLLTLFESTEKGLKEALEIIDKVISHREHDYDAHSIKAIILFQLEDYDRATVACDKALAIIAHKHLQLSPDKKAFIYYLKCITLITWGKITDAEQLLEKAQRKFSQLPRSSFYHIVIASKHIAKHSYESAIAELNLADTIVPDAKLKESINLLQQQVALAADIKIALQNKQLDVLKQAIKAGNIEKVITLIDNDNALGLKLIVDDSGDNKYVSLLEFAKKNERWPIFQWLLQNRATITTDWLDKLIIADANVLLLNPKADIYTLPSIYKNVCELSCQHVIDPEIFNFLNLRKYEFQISLDGIKKFIDDRGRHELNIELKSLLMLRILVYYFILVKANSGIIKTPAATKLGAELILVVEILNAYQEISLIHDIGEKVSQELAQRCTLIHLKRISEKIANLSPCASYCYPSGLLNHALYVNFIHLKPYIQVRIDNLGYGSEHERHPSYIRKPTKTEDRRGANNKRVLPFITTHSYTIDAFKNKDKEAIEYLGRLFQANFLEEKDFPLQHIYTKGHKPLEEYPSEWSGPEKVLIAGCKAQNEAKDCVLRNLNVGFKLRHNKSAHKEIRRLEAAEITSLHNQVSIIKNISFFQSAPIAETQELKDKIKPEGLFAAFLRNLAG